MPKHHYFKISNLIIATSLFSLLIISSITYSQTQQNPQTPTSTPSPIVDICNASTQDLNKLDKIVADYVASNDVGAAEKLTSQVDQISKPWHERSLSNTCNDFRSNPITCPETSVPMQSLVISDSMIAIMNSLNLQVNKAFTKTLIQQFFSNAKKSHENLCAQKLKAAQP